MLPIRTVPWFLEGTVPGVDDDEGGWLWYALGMEQVDLERVDVKDRRWAISREDETPISLVQSVKRFGVISPPLLRRQGNGRLQVFHGFRRLEAAHQIGLPRVPARLGRSQESKALFLQAAEEHLTGRPLEIVEKAALLRLLQGELELSESELVRDYLPRMGLQSDHRTLRRYFALDRLPPHLHRSVGRSLEIDVALSLARLSTERQAFITDLIERYRLGRNKQRELFELLDEIYASQPRETNLPPYQLWCRLGADEIEKQSNLSPVDKRNRILDLLRRRRFPKLWEHQDKLDRLKSSLNLPPELDLRTPARLEGNQLRFSVAATRPDDLHRWAAELVRIADSPQLQEIFELL